MPSSTSVRLTVNGVNRTQRMFAAVRANVALMASQVKAAGLAAAAGAGAVGAAIATSAGRFSALGDRATQAGVAASDLNGLVSGLKQAGAKGASIESVADALSSMTKATGAVGKQGFADTLASIAALGDEGARVQELSRIFGRSFGPGLAALVRQGPDAARASVDQLIQAGPQLSDSLVAAGDAIADGMQNAKDNVKAGWDEAWVSIGAHFADYFGKPQRQFWADIGSYVRFGMQAAFRYVAEFAGAAFNLFANFRTLWDAVFGEQGLGGIVARWLLKAWNHVVAFGEGILARFVFVKDALAAIFTDDTIADAQQRFFDRMEANRTKLAENNAVADAMFGDASLGKIKEAFKAAGVTFETDVSDLGERLANDLARNSSGVLDAIQGKVADAAGDAADSSAKGSLGPLRDAKAMLANTYDAFRVGRQSGSTPAEKAATDTAKAATTTAQNTSALTRLVQKIATALTGVDPLAVLA